MVCTKFIPSLPITVLFFWEKRYSGNCANLKQTQDKHAQIIRTLCKQTCTVWCLFAYTKPLVEWVDCGMKFLFWQFCMHFPGQTCSRPLDQRALLASQSYDVSLSIEIMGSKVNTPALLQQRRPWRSEQLSCFWPLPCCWYLWAALYLLSPCIGPLKGHWGLQSAFEWRLLTRLFACFSPGTVARAARQCVCKPT